MRWSLLGGMVVAGLAWASPWDIDMIDSAGFKAYEWKMPNARVEGTVPRPQGAIVRAGGTGSYQNDYIPQHDRLAADVDSLKNPYPVDDAVLAKGKEQFQITCAPCHGAEGKGGGPVTQNKPNDDITKAIRRFPMPAPLLSGQGSVSSLRSDGYLYLTIRNGGVAMPKYGLSLTDQERWGIIAYIRTLEGAAWTPPAEPATPGENP
jgi:mono/diheme cytochrome c family protein